MQKLLGKVFGTILVLGLLLSACDMIDPEGTTILGQEEVVAGQEFRLVAVTPVTEDQEIQSDSWTFNGEDYSGDSDIFNPVGDQYAVVNLVDLMAPEAAGTYTATYTLTLEGDDGTTTFEESHEVEVIVVDDGEEDDDDEDDEGQAEESCPAAPAIATDYMREIGVQPGSDDWKMVVRNVAQETGSDGEFWAANSCDSGYREEVTDYVDSLLAE